MGTLFLLLSESASRRVQKGSLRLFSPWLQMMSFKKKKQLAAPALTKPVFTTAFRQNSSAFTIVELLIVVVVIAILAAVTIVAYNGITNRAKGSAVASSVTQAGKKLEVFKTTTGAGFYPADITAANTAIGSSLTLTKYLTNTPTNPTNYCATITDTSTSPATSYSVSSTSSTTMAGECVENLVRNPGSELVGMGYNTGGSGSVVRTTADKYAGVASSLLTAGSSYLYASPSSATASAGETFRWSMAVKSSKTPIRVAYRYTGATWSSVLAAVTVSQWQIITGTTIVPAGGSTFHAEPGWETSDSPSGATLYVDSFIITRGATNYAYGDGDSPGWFWTGAPNNSTSIGPSVAL